ncbi:methyltransferase domain-containing protein [Luteimonas mephitis]|uniref:methyltransferase domain-containing protein n=1 Tax=Luteimonas mephitis TaxID=83615 RepID=UPI00146B4B78
MLDIGAGDRWLSHHLPDGVDYIALDYPPTGRDLYHARPDVFADAARLPIADQTIDAVVCLEVLEHVRRPREVLGEIARVLRPGGRLYLSMPFLYPIHDAPFDFQRLTEHGLRRDIEQAGLQVTAIEKSGHAVCAAGLLLCLAISGGAYYRKGLLSVLLMPIAAMLVTVINLSTVALGRLWPDWSGMATGYSLEAVKP